MDVPKFFLSLSLSFFLFLSLAYRNPLTSSQVERWSMTKSPLALLSSSAQEVGCSSTYPSRGPYFSMAPSIHSRRSRES